MRGVANADLTPELAMAIGRALGLSVHGGGSVLVGRDTRRSGEMLAAALAAGIASAGDDVVLARMAAAAEVLGAAGMPVSRAADSLRMAIGWQRYAEGPVSELHRSCGLDLTRGALRLWDRREPKR